MLVEEFGFPPDYWRTITVPEFFAWHELVRQRQVLKANQARRSEYEQRKQQLPRGGV